MPVTETTRIVPKSVLRHRPLREETASPLVPAWTTTTPRASRTTQKKQKTRPAKYPKPSLKKKWRLPVRPGHERVHWLVPAVLGMAVMVILTILANMAVQGMTEISTDLRYGMPRTMQLDAVVGHHDDPAHPTHLLAENMRGRVVIIEFPGGDVQQARILVGPEIAGPNADQVPVLLTLVDRQKNHQPDLLVQFGSMEVWYLNQHGSFVVPN